MQAKGQLRASYECNTTNLRIWKQVAVRKNPNWKTQMVSGLDKCKRVSSRYTEIYVNTWDKIDKEVQTAPWIAPHARGALTKLRP